MELALTCKRVSKRFPSKTSVTIATVKPRQKWSSSLPSQFQHSAELSTSPDNTFSNSNICRKQSIAAKLLDQDCGSYTSTSDEVEFVRNPKLTKIVENCVTYTNGPRDLEDGPATASEEAPTKKSSHCDSRMEKSFTESIVSQPEHCLNDIGKCNGFRKAGGYLLAVHRKLSRQDTYFLSYHKTRPSLFGVPLLIPCYEDGTNKDLYCAVWIQVARLLSPLPSTPPEQSNHATDWWVALDPNWGMCSKRCLFSFSDDSLGYEFPFILRAVSEGGRLCALCPWSKFCRGCEIPCNDEPLLQGSISSSSKYPFTAPFPDGADQLIIQLFNSRQ